MQQVSRFGPLGLCLATLLIQTNAFSVPLTITLEFNGELVKVIEDEPIVSIGGMHHFVGQYLDPEQEWLVTWNYWISPDPLSGVVIDGTSTIKNVCDADGQYQLTTTVPVCPGIVGDSRIGASIAVTLITAPGGGAMWDFEGLAIWSVLADGQQVRTVFDAPFLLFTSGEGVMTLTSQFGTPIPSEPSGPFPETISLRRNFSMTPGETAVFHSFLNVISDHGSVEDCPIPGDLNGDGIVNALDLLIMLAEWGQCADPDDCPADLNGDGVVDALDLLMLLDSWG